MLEVFQNPAALFLVIVMAGTALFEIMRLVIPHISASMSAPAMFGLAMSGLDVAGTVDWTMFANQNCAYAIGLAITAVIWYMRARTKPMTGADR